MAGPAHGGRSRGTERSDGEGSTATLKRSRRAGSITDRTPHPSGTREFTKWLARRLCLEESATPSQRSRRAPGRPPACRDGTHAERVAQA